ncbi:3-hydroxypropanoate dehydrogenase [Variovorax sp. OAS795]|uniref:malonic semialdehyde reductase n=1 Tax=Variovorax sp. OAS795 TaxID=3034231 RepID=UPI003395E472
MIPDSALDTLFRQARSHNGWLPRPVSEAQLRQIYELVKWGPTSANCSPMRVVFVRSDEGRERLRPLLSPGNVEKTMTAPVTAILAFDTAFYRELPRLFPHRPGMQADFIGPDKEQHALRTAFRNASLQAGYFMLAARAIGLDCGPMSGFDVAGMDAAFWQGTSVRTNFLCNLGHGDPAHLFDRHPRLAFEEACRFA